MAKLSGRALFVATSLCLLFTAASAAFAQTTATASLPDTAAGRSAAAYLAAFNSGDADRMAAFLTRAYPTSPWPADILVSIRRARGPLEVRKVVRSSQDGLEFIGEFGITETRRLITIRLASGSTMKIQSIDLAPLKDGEQPAIARLNEARMATLVHAKLAAYGQNFSGVVLVAHRGHTIFASARGYANQEARVPNTLETQFRVGSMDKMFTAVAIAQLVETGRVDLDAAFGTYLSDYPNKSLASSVTLRQLLNHTGGTGDIFGPVFDANRAHLRTLADYVALYGARAGKFPAGARWDYSNYGYILLGRVIEAVTGQSYYDYLENHLFRPAGMTHTGFAPEDEKLPDRAVAYDGASDMSRRADDTLPYRGTSAGGGYSTAGDLLAFAEALEAGKIISPSTLKAFSTGTMETPMAERYGLGFTERIANGAQVIGHSGGAPGMNADFGILDGGRGVVIVLSNFSPPTAQEFADFIEERAPVD